MITRRQFSRQLMAGTSILAAASIAACNGTTTTLGQLLVDIQKGCGFVTTWQNLAPVVVTVVAGFNAAAGAAATLAVDAATRIKDMVCAQVMAHPTAQTSELRAAASTAGQTITIHVNGVPVTGQLTAKHP